MAGIAEPYVPVQPAKPQAAPSASRAVSIAGLREFASLGLLVGLADVAIFRGAGYAGLAVLLVAGPALLLLGSPQRRIGASFWIVVAMIVLLAARMLWLGNVLTVLLGAALLVAYALALRGIRPYVPDVLAGAVQLLVAGIAGLASYRQAANAVSPKLSRALVPNLLLPVLAVALFGTLFVLANPDLVTSVNEIFQRLSQRLTDWLEGLSHNWLEVAFCLAAGYITIGLLRPLIVRSLFPDHPPANVIEAEIVPGAQETPWYGPVRNTLWAVNGLFVAYLLFEFQTLWFREFPKGFYYAGYAHEGAAWLTAALALATLVLSLIFRGHVLADPRLGRLRVLAWIWSALNVLLAISVYHRMSIYIDFNGMTRMRMVGLFGITTVLAGFALVLWKIIHNRSFLWLIQRQLWALALAVYLFALTPVDWIVHSYNVRRILAGDLAPAVQISVHPISAEGYLVLGPLADCDDRIIRDGMRAMLAQRFAQAQRTLRERSELGWTSRQISEESLQSRLASQRNQWQDMNDLAARRAALARFRHYAYQWY
jgi:hypothetical protein